MLVQAISAEEMARRRNELAKMRSLMFRHEAKAQRLAKIKSKDYHRRINKASRRKVITRFTERLLKIETLPLSMCATCKFFPLLMIESSSVTIAAQWHSFLPALIATNMAIMAA